MGFSPPRGESTRGRRIDAPTRTPRSTCKTAGPRTGRRPGRASGTGRAFPGCPRVWRPRPGCRRRTVSPARGGERAARSRGSLPGTGLARSVLSPEVVAVDARPLVLVVVLLVLMAGEAGVAPRNPPHVGAVALLAGEGGVVPLPVQAPLALMALAARRDRLRLGRLPVTVPACHGHHGGGGVDLVALGAVVGGPVPRGVAFAAQSPGVLSFQLHAVPRHLGAGHHRTEGRERPALRHGVADRALRGQDLPAFRDVPAVVATEAARPVPVPDIRGVRLPVHLHVRE